MRKSSKKAKDRNVNDPAFARIHENRIEELRESILGEAVAKQEYEKIFRKLVAAMDSPLYYLIRPILVCNMNIRIAVDEIRRLRGWLPD